MTTMTGGRALVKSLVSHGIDTLFCIPGVQLDHLFNALYEERNAVRVINTRHEQAAAYMAFGYAQAGARPGAFAVVPGPGFLNATAALSTAYACNAPVLCVSGQIPSAQIGRGLGLLHEIPDQLGVMQSLTKWAARITDPAETPATVAEAFRQLSTGRVRPVGIEVPLDVLPMEADVALSDPAPPDPAPAPDPGSIADAAERLGRAENPIIFVGGGIFGAETELKALAEALQAPVVMSYSGLGALDCRHPLAHTYTGGHRLVAEADVILAVGTRIQRPLMGWKMAEGRTLIRIDIDAEEIDRIVPPAVAVNADARQALAALNAVIGDHNRERADRSEEMARVKAAVEADFAVFEPQMSFLRALRAALPEDGIFVEDLTQVGYLTRFAFPVYRPRSYISTGYQGTLGFGFATALGVKVARPDAPVLAISGDGGFLYTAAELATAVQHNIPVVAVVFRDDAYGNVRRAQVEQYGGKVIGTDLVNPDFAQLAETFGALGLRAKSPDELTGAIATGFASGRPTVIEVPLGDTPDPHQLLHMGPVPPGRG